MKKTLTTNEAADLLLADKNAGWSYAGARALVAYVEGIEKDAGEEIEFDAVALRCDYAEYASALEAAGECGFVPESEDEDDAEAAALEWLEYRTEVILFVDGFHIIIEQF